MTLNEIIRQKLLMAFLLWAIMIYPCLSYSQGTTDVYVDDKGLMRWGKNKEEVMGFGVNYTVPFAHAYRMAERLGIPHEKAIDEDVYHFARLGLDLYRVHVWDTEISDTVGNLLENEHLRLFDYAIKKMKERGMKFIITPIAYWGNGWPEPDGPTPGFSAKFGKGPSLINSEAIKAQENYLYQFLNHKNPYTDLAYWEDPDVIAFEISNEPHHGGSTGEVTGFINNMVHSIRKTGTKKPIFYNMSHSTHLGEGYFNAEIEGGTFQWYPTNLVAGREIQGNFLPNVDQYTYPWAETSRFKNMAKIVYEFDAADVGASYIYPAMARSFREAGLQLAAHFAYDAGYMAPFNTEYGTHYMNLCYAPQKALSLKIASEVYHTIPLYKNFGSYPENTTFGDFRVDYEKDLAEMVSKDKFFYTNHTTTTPPSPGNLKQIAGYGNSPVINYEGKGAYFLDRLEKGTWRLEVMPDAIWVQDPFGKASLKKTVSAINWREWPMSITLPDLGKDFTIEALNDDNDYVATVNKTSFSIQPGAYLIKRKGFNIKLNLDSQLRNIKLKEFVAPPSSLEKAYVLHDPITEVSLGNQIQISAEIVTDKEPEEVELHIFGMAGSEVINLKKSVGYTYTATIPEKLMQKGFLQYYISLKQNGSCLTFPSGNAAHPKDWDFIGGKPYEIRVVSNESPVYLFNAISDAEKLMRVWIRESGLMPAENPAMAEYIINMEKIPQINPESNVGKKEHNYAMRYYFRDKIKGRIEDLQSKKKLVVKGRSLIDKNLPLEIALVMKDGSAFGGIVKTGTEQGDYEILLNDLKNVKLVNLPRPYPGFLPYYFQHQSAASLDLNAVENLQFSIGPGIPENEIDKQYSIAIESVRLE